jgi:riboflavin kinase / FMN adenylyltransferase
MKIVHSLSEISFDKNSVVSIGTFDGVHKAHQCVLEEVVRRAKSISGRSIIVTFEPHPREIVSGDKRIDILTTFDEKIQLIKKIGIDYILVIPFTYEFSRKTFLEFYTEYIIDGIGVSAVIEGHNHHLGRDRDGSMNQIVELGKRFDFTVEAISLLKIEDIQISSTSIRNLLLEGKVILSNLMFGYEYNFTGQVVRGHGMGRKLGYPTANIKLQDSRKLIPRIGVYAVRIKVKNVWYDGMMSIGKLPTFYDNHDLSTEVNIFEFDQDIYDELVTVQCIDYTRDQLKFQSVDDLINEMNNDKVITQRILKSYTLLQ